MNTYLFHIEHGGSAFKRIHLVRENTRHEAVSRLIEAIGGHSYATGLVISWEESGKYRPHPDAI